MQLYSEELRARGVRQIRHCFPAGLASAVGAAMLVFTAAPVAFAGEEVSAGSTGSDDGEIMICLREQNLLGDYGPERCITRASLIAGLGASGFGPAATWVDDSRHPVQPATEYRLRNADSYPEFEAFDIEQTARTHAPIAIWVLSYNVKELSSTYSEPERYWPLMRLDGHQSIGLSALDPGIERNPTGLKAFGLRISLPY